MVSSSHCQCTLPTYSQGLVKRTGIHHNATPAFGIIVWNAPDLKAAAADFEDRSRMGLVAMSSLRARSSTGFMR